MKTLLAALMISVAGAMPALTDDDPKKDDGFVPMFNGTDLTGWVNVNCAPGTFFVKDKQIITTGKPTGYLRTDKQYENFIADFDWMHVPPKKDAVGNSGFFVWADPIPAVGTGYTRGIEVQVLVNLHWTDKKTGLATATSHGDLFSIWGAKCVPERPHPLGWERCIPSENRAKGANEWNHYRVEGNDGVLSLAVNGKVVSKVSKCKPRKGYLALESEGSECRFKNLKIKELPSTNPKKDEIADVAQGHKSLYSGLDLSGWKADDNDKKHWQARDTVLHYDGKGKEKSSLWTEKEFGDCEIIIDFRFPADNKIGVGIELPGFEYLRISKQNRFKDLKPAGQWNRLQAILQGKSLKVSINGKKASPIEDGNRTKGAIILRAFAPMDFANLFVRELGKKD